MKNDASAEKKSKSLWQRVNWLLVAFGITVGYVGWLFYSLGHSRIVTFLHDNEIELNQVGDFLAGAFAPIALIWLVAAVLTQRQELNETRDQFEASQKAIHQQLANGKMATNAQINFAFETASANYKFSLFDKRVAAYNKLVESGRAIFFKQDKQNDAIKTIIEAVNESKLIFGGPISDAVDEIEAVVLSYLKLDHEMAYSKHLAMGIPDEESMRYDQYVKERDEHLRRLADLLKYKRLSELFVPNIKLPGEIEKPKAVEQ